MAWAPRSVWEGGAVLTEAEAERLRADVRQHKAAIGHHRRQLQHAAELLAAFEADCRRRGVRIIKVPVSVHPQHQQAGEGRHTHGRPTSHDDPAS